MNTSSMFHGAPIGRLLNRASEAHSKKDINETIRICRRILADVPTHVEAMTILARALVTAKRLNSARAILDDLAVITPSNTAPRALKCEILLRQRQLTRAWQASRAVLVLDPINVRGWQVLARIRSMQGRAHELASFLGPLSCLRPNDAAVAIGWARALMEVRDLARAEGWCRRAISLGGDQPARLFDLARVLRAKGDIAGSEDLLNRVLSRDPGFKLKVRALRLTATANDFARPKPEAPS